MSKLEWDANGQRFYEIGVHNCVLFVKDDNGLYRQGVPWNGIASITESSSGASVNSLMSDDIRCKILLSPELFGATIEAYTYPDEFAECNGEVKEGLGLYSFEQERREFALCYKTNIGNEDGINNYKIHIIYGAVALPTESAYASLSDSSEALLFSWDLETTPVEFIGSDNRVSFTSHMEIDSRDFENNDSLLNSINKILFGDNTQTTPSNWTSNHSYVKYSDSSVIVKNGSDYYICIEAHTSGSSFDDTNFLKIHYTSGSSSMSSTLPMPTELIKYLKIQNGGNT